MKVEDIIERANMQNTTCVMEDNIINKINYYKIKKRDDTQQIRYITQLAQKIIKSQKSILQPVSGNGKKKIKKKVEIRHSTKKR